MDRAEAIREAERLLDDAFTKSRFTILAELYDQAYNEGFQAAARLASTVGWGVS